MEEIINTGWEIINLKEDTHHGSLKEFWLKRSGDKWPEQCSVDGCTNVPTIGAVIANPVAKTDKVVPVCERHPISVPINVRGGVTLVRIGTKITTKLGE